MKAGGDQTSGCSFELVRERALHFLVLSQGISRDQSDVRYCEIDFADVNKAQPGAELFGDRCGVMHRFERSLGEIRRHDHGADICQAPGTEGRIEAPNT